MRKWKLYGIKPMAPPEDQPHNVDLSEWRTPSLLSRVLAWTARLWRWLASLWAANAALVTAEDSSDSITADRAEEEEPSHALTSSGTSPPHASASSLLQSISCSSDLVPFHEGNSSQAETHAAEGEAIAPPQTRPAPQRRLTRSGRPKALSSLADSPNPESTVSVSCSGDITVNLQRQLQRASTWPQNSSIHRQASSSWAPSHSQPGLATSNSSDIILAHSLPQDHSDAPHSCPGPQAASSEAGTSQAATSQEFHTTFVVKAGQASSGGIEEVKGASSPEAEEVSSSPRIAAVQSRPQQDAEGEEKPAWKVKLDARRARVQQQKLRAGKCMPA